MISIFLFLLRNDTSLAWQMQIVSFSAEPFQIFLTQRIPKKPQYTLKLRIASRSIKKLNLSPL